MQNLHRRFDWHYIGEIYDGDFAKLCGLLRIYELYYTIYYTDGHPDRAFFSKIPNFWAWADKLGQIM